MTILLSRGVASEKYVKTCDIDEKHSCPEYVACWVGCDADPRDCMSCIEVNRFDLGESGEVVLFSIENIALI